MISSLVTFFGWGDNTPPQSATFGYAGMVGMGGSPAPGGGSGVSASAVGTWNDPIPFGSDMAEFPPGTIIWVPQLQKYFTMATDCQACDQVWASGQQYEVSLWTGTADTSDMYSEENCETFLGTKIIPKGSPVPIVVSPPSSEPVNTMPLFNSGTDGCFPANLVYANVPNSQQVVGIATPEPSLGPGVPPPKGEQWVVYWEGAGSLSSMPQGITSVDLAFATMTNSQVHFDPNAFGGDVASGIRAMHARGVSVVLSIGGAGNPFQFTGDLATFTSSLQNIVRQYGFDGVDFDDEDDQSAGPRASALNKVIPAARQMFTQLGRPNAIVTLAAYGGSPDDFGDGAVIRSSGSALSWINLMAYAPNLGSVQGMTTPYNGLLPPAKIVVGGIDNGGDLGGPMPVGVATQLAGWVKSQGYGGVMMWTIDQGQQYVAPVASALGS